MYIAHGYMILLRTTLLLALITIIIGYIRMYFTKDKQGFMHIVRITGIVVGTVATVPIIAYMITFILLVIGIVFN